MTDDLLSRINIGTRGRACFFASHLREPARGREAALRSGFPLASAIVGFTGRIRWPWMSDRIKAITDKSDVAVGWSHDDLGAYIRSATAPVPRDSSETRPIRDGYRRLRPWGTGHAPGIQRLCLRLGCVRRHRGGLSADHCASGRPAYPQAGQDTSGLAGRIRRAAADRGGDIAVDRYGGRGNSSAERVDHRPADRE
jgi:hypothetical protein